MNARLPFLFYFIFFHSCNTTSEHSASDACGINDYFMRSAYAKAGATANSAALRQQFLTSDFTTCPKTLPFAAPRRDPETILLDESEEAEGAAEEGRPIPVKVGDKVYIPQLPSLKGINSYWDNADDKRMLKRYRASTNDGHDDFDFDYRNIVTRKLPATNK